MSDSPSLDPYRPPEAVQRVERTDDDPDWLGRPSACKTCGVEFVVENRYRRYLCEACDGKSTFRGWFILLGLFVLYVLGNFGYFLVALMLG